MTARVVFPMEANMLMLKRNIGESIYIGNNVKIKLVNAKGKRVIIGIEAPESISILRTELEKRKTLTT